MAKRGLAVGLSLALLLTAVPALTPVLAEPADGRLSEYQNRLGSANNWTDDFQSYSPGGSLSEGEAIPETDYAPLDADTVVGSTTYNQTGKAGAKKPVMAPKAAKTPVAVSGTDTSSTAMLLQNTGVGNDMAAFFYPVQAYGAPDAARGKVVSASGWCSIGRSNGENGPSFLYSYTDSRNYEYFYIAAIESNGYTIRRAKVTDGVFALVSGNSTSWSGNTTYTTYYNDYDTSAQTNCTVCTWELTWDYAASTAALSLKNAAGATVGTLVTATPFPEGTSYFAFGIRPANQKNAQFDNISVTVASGETTPAQALAVKFAQPYAQLLGYAYGDTPLPGGTEELTGIQALIFQEQAAYAQLGAAEKASVDAADLQSKMAALASQVNAALSSQKYVEMMEKGVYTTNFEDGVHDWEQYADFHNQAGDVIEQQDYAVLDNTWTQGLQAGASGKVLKIDTSLKSTDFVKAQGQTDNQFIYGQQTVAMLSPNRRLWEASRDQGKPFTAASGDILVNASYINACVTIPYRYVDENNFSYFTIGRATSTEIDVRRYHVSLSADGYRTYEVTSPSNVRYAFAGWTTHNDNWLHFELYYDEAGHAVLSLTGNTGDTMTVSTETFNNETVPVDSRMFAVGLSPTFRSNGVRNAANTAVDNIALYFGSEGVAEATAFKNANGDLLSFDAARVAPYDVNPIIALSSDYAALSNDAKNYLTAEKAAIDALQSAAGVWDTATDEAVAASYKAIWGGRIAAGAQADVQAAWNVLNRLTASQKALLQTEYQTLSAAMAGFTQKTDDTIDIACVGDSITYGSGSTSAANNSYPARLQALLGGGYQVQKYAIPGYRVLNATDLSATTDASLQFEVAKPAEWTSSHNDKPDIVIVQLGTNDLRNVVVGGENGRRLYETAFEKLLQTYLRLDNSPIVIVSDCPVSYSSISSGAVTQAQSSTVAKINMALAEKYGLPFVDTYALTAALDSSEVDVWYAADKLHLSDTGYQRYGETFAAAVSSMTTLFDTADVTGFAYTEAGMNAFLAPELISATIRKSASTDAQDLRFKTVVSRAVKTGAAIVEYGTVFAPYPDVKDQLDSMVYNAADNPNILVARNTKATNAAAGEIFYASLGGIPAEKLGLPVAARSYVKFSDGTVYYSRGSTQGGSLEARTGVQDGYACRSVISIAKTMLLLLDSNQVDVSSVATVNGGVITWADGATDNNGAAIIAFLYDNADKIENLAPQK